MEITKGRLKQIIKEEVDMMHKEEVDMMQSGEIPMGYDSSVGGQDQELDYEGYMTKNQLYKIGQYALEMHEMIQDGDNLPEWMQSKIAEMARAIGDVKHALEYDKERGTV